MRWNIILAVLAIPAVDAIAVSEICVPLVAEFDCATNTYSRNGHADNCLPVFNRFSVPRQRRTSSSAQRRSGRCLRDAFCFRVQCTSL